MFKEVTKTLLEYMEQLTNTIEKIDVELTTLRRRISILERNKRLSQVNQYRSFHSGGIKEFKEA